MRMTREEYIDYLQSEQWAAKRELVLTRANGLCDVPGCLREPSEVHHLTYDRLGEEDWRDLAAVCEPCSRLLHDPMHPPDAPCVAAHEYEWAMTDPCPCPFCTYRREAYAANLRIRRKLAKSLNTFLLGRNEAVKGSRPATLKQQWCVESALLPTPKDLPPSLLCHRTGLAAGTDGSCGRCDSCLYIAALESADFEGEERNPDDTA